MIWRVLRRSWRPRATRSRHCAPRSTIPTTPRLGIYTNTADGRVQRVHPASVIEQLGLGDMINENMMMGATNAAVELVNDQTMRDNDYDLVTGRWPQNYNEVVLITTHNNEISDYTLYALGLLDITELENVMADAQKDMMENGALTQEINVDHEATSLHL